MPPQALVQRARACGSRVLLDASVRAQRLDDVQLLPRQVEVGAAEVAVRRYLLVDRAAQLEAVDDRGGAQVEMLLDQAADDLLVDMRGAERLERDRGRVRDADGVRDLHLEAVGEAGGDDVLGDVTGGVRG